jgi:hypothetical protein
MMGQAHRKMAAIKKEKILQDPGLGVKGFLKLIGDQDRLRT